MITLRPLLGDNWLWAILPELILCFGGMLLILVDAFFPRIADFQKPPRHPKWKEANLTAVVPGWKRHDAAEERNHQRLDRQLIAREGAVGCPTGLVVRRERFGGRLSDDHREAA